MQFPDNLKYSKDHEWVRVEGDEAYVGITEFAACDHQILSISFIRR